MSRRLQLDVRNLSLGRRHLVNAYEVKAGMHGVICRWNCVIHAWAPWPLLIWCWVCLKMHTSLVVHGVNGRSWKMGLVLILTRGGLAVLSKFGCHWWTRTMRGRVLQQLGPGWKMRTVRVSLDDSVIDYADLVTVIKVTCHSAAYVDYLPVNSPER